MKKWIMLVFLMIPLISALSNNDFEININLEKDSIFVDDSLDVVIEIKDKKQRIDFPVLIDYLIQDSSGELLIKDSRTVILKGNEMFTKEFYLSPSTKPGEYIFILNMEYENESYTKSELFNVYEKKEIKISRYVNYFIFGIVLIIVMLLLIFVIFERFRLRRIHKNLDSNLGQIHKHYLKKKKTNDTVKKLNKQKMLLEKAYKSKYISRESFVKSKKRINKMLSKIKK